MNLPRNSHPRHDYDGLEVPSSSDPFDVFLNDKGTLLDDDTDETIEDMDFNDEDEY